MFVTLEGTEGSGKTTQCQMLRQHLVEKGHDVLLTREPGGTKIGQQVREVLFDQRNHDMTPEAEFLLFSASRAQLVRDVIKPHLTKGGVVVCDRYFDSSLAYQGYGHGLGHDVLREVTRIATGGLRPNLTLLLDLPPEEGLRRRRRQRDQWNRLDAHQLSFHSRVRQGFLELARDEPDRWEVIDASQSTEHIFRSVRELVEELQSSLYK
ncbi:MAG: dTMP kinase [Anaerolineales bacterium]|nr:dTMP kinase [Anaerolineales bacterium]